jgi:hypothetical protein
MDSAGNTVYDSGSITEQAAMDAQLYPDARSDDKGTEPESVITYAMMEQGVMKTFAFVGLERASAVCVFDVTDPYQVEYRQILDVKGTSGFESPEGLVAADGLLFVASEYVKGLAIYSLPDYKAPTPATTLAPAPKLTKVPTKGPTKMPTTVASPPSGTAAPTPQATVSWQSRFMFWIWMTKFLSNMGGMTGY